MWRMALIIVVAIAASNPVQAKPKQDKKQTTTQHVGRQQTAVESKNTFSTAERNLIRAHLQRQERATAQQRQKGLPPGLQKKVARGKALPPGWQKKLVPGKSLDYQVYRQGKSLPEEILRRLPSLPAGSEILQVEDQILRINSATRNIHDAFGLTPTQ